MTRLQGHIHDVRAMSACVPTADVSLHRGEPPLRADFEKLKSGVEAKIRDGSVATSIRQ
jgi:hypothetical protein